MQRTSVFILNFHCIGTPRRELTPGEQKVWIDESKFHSLLDFARSHPEVELTFDDGNASDHTIALPALQARGMKAQFFLVADRVDRQGYLSRAQLNELVAAGMQIGSHGMRHRPWAELDQSGLYEELVEARDKLQQVVNTSIRHASCPFGSYNRRVIRALRRGGYERVYTSDGGSARADSFLLPRNSVSNACTPANLETLLCNGSQPISRIIHAVKLLIKKCR
jgi:peptidoglycan/xylan/chitin deacetylase (PgdA/CDA1 family)